MKLCFSRHWYNKLETLFINMDLSPSQGNYTTGQKSAWLVSVCSKTTVLWSWNVPNSVKMKPTNEGFSLGNQKLKLIACNALVCECCYFACFADQKSLIQCTFISYCKYFLLRPCKNIWPTIFIFTLITKAVAVVASLVSNVVVGKLVVN